MGIRQVLKKSDAIVGLYNDLGKIRGYSEKSLSIAQHSAIQQYVQNHSVRKLQIGSGPNHIPGWLGTDIAPRSDEIAYLDATKPFPIADGTFDYVFSEHMIEHISWQNGLLMLRECQRVLKRGGVLRIATPDLAVLLSLYQADRGAAAEQYIKWITDRFLPDIEVYKAQFVINNAFRNFQHQFLYDGEVLKMAMNRVGLVDIVRCAPGESAHVDLQGIEAHGVVCGDEEMNAFETMVFEGRRPA